MQTGKAISIPSVLKVGKGTLNKIGEYLKSEELTSVVIFMGNGLIDMFGDAIMKSLTDAGITVLEYSELDTVEIDDIITIEDSFCKRFCCTASRIRRMAENALVLNNF